MEGWEEGGEERNVGGFVYGEDGGGEKCWGYIESRDDVGVKKVRVGLRVGWEWRGKGVIEKGGMYL